MSGFSLTVFLACSGVIGVLLIYTLWLMRSGKLNAHVTVRWLLAEIAVFIALMLWPFLPFIGVTSKLDDRELLVILVVLFFSFIVFLILDCLTRISTQSSHIKVLVQEIALLREETMQETPMSKAKAKAKAKAKTKTS